MKIQLLFAFVTAFLISCTASTPLDAPNDSNSTTDSISSAVGLTDFLEEILLGFQMSAIAKHMVQTPYKFLGETELLLNYEDLDENKVTYFVSFQKNFDDPEYMGAMYLSIDFRNNNSHLVNEYQERLSQQLDAVYGEWSEDFSTGYTMDGNYEAEWYFEAGVLTVKVGPDFINVDLHEH
jgi:hypothetical protein